MTQYINLAGVLEEMVSALIGDFPQIFLAVASLRALPPSGHKSPR